MMHAVDCVRFARIGEIWYDKRTTNPMSRPPVISEIECRIVKVPVIQDRANSPEFGAQPLGPQRLIVRLRDSDGVEGWGEGRSGTEDFEEVLPRLLGRAVSELRPQYVDLWAAGSQYWHLPTPPSKYAAPMENYIFRLRHPMQPLVEMALMDLIGR